ncbi:MAG TPA: CHAT domain-containing protein [Ignavibacteriaceae bacterium]
MPDSLIDKEKDLQADLSFYDSKLREAEESDNLKLADNYRNKLLDSKRNYDELTGYINGNFPSYFLLKHPAALSSTAEIRKLLTPDAALVEYFTGDTTVTIFVLTQTSINAVSVNCDSTLFNEVRKFRESLQKFNFINYLSAASALYYKLISPVKNFLKDKSRLYIIPDNIFSYLPFEALITGKPPVPFNRNFDHLPYLINNYNISYHYSAASLKETLLKQNSSPMSFTAFAPIFSNDKRDMDYITSLIDTNLVNYNPRGKFGTSGRKYGQLTEAETEVNSISDVFSENNYSHNVLSGKTATVTELKSEKMHGIKFIHLATYGFLNEKHPALSGLLFHNSGDSTNTGILHAGEIYGLNLKSDLMVLSACESGLGKTVTGRGILSVLRSFMYAGTDNIVLSLWLTEDLSTSVLMQEFYKNIIEGMDYSSALRKSKLDLIRGGKYSYPQAWCPFVLYGH